jgi:cytoskeletal protein CcmA (bactofilin family)
MRNKIQTHRTPVRLTGAQQACDDRTAGALRVALLGLLLAMCGCGNPSGGDASHKINGAVHVDTGKAPDSVETVNGSIQIDPNATVTRVATVNGGIHVGAHATANSVKTVNGAITLDEGVRVAGAVESVNGALTLRDGADVTGALKNVAGRIEVRSAHVAGGIRTVAGDISILGSSRVEGGVVVQKPGNELFRIGSDIPRVVIGPGASVQGDLRFERDVHLYVSDKATVGPVNGATAVSFTGDSPPN